MHNQAKGFLSLVFSLILGTFLTTALCCWQAFGAPPAKNLGLTEAKPAGSVKSPPVEAGSTKQPLKKNGDLTDLELKKTDSLQEEAPSSLFDLTEESGLEAEWKIASGLNMFFETGKSVVRESRLPFEMGVHGRFKWEFSDFLSIHAEGLVLARRGFQQSFLEREDLKDGVNFSNFYYKIKTPLKLFASPLIFQFGIINQEFLKAPFLLTDTSFTGLLAKSVFSFNENSRLSFFLQGAIPYNAEHLFVRPDQLNKAWPFFLSSSGFLDWDDLWGFKIGESLTFFYMDNLTPEIADKSQTYGNTVDSFDASSRFEYGFAGLYNSFSLSRKFLNRWIVGIKWDHISNFLAPKDSNMGDKIQASLYHDYRDFMELGLAVEYFRNESDSSVAYFSSENYGHNNRRGIRLKLQSHLYSSGLTFQAIYTYMNPIQKKTWMGRINSFSLILKSNYASI